MNIPSSRLEKVPEGPIDRSGNGPRDSWARGVFGEFDYDTATAWIPYLGVSLEINGTDIDVGEGVTADDEALVFGLFMGVGRGAMEGLPVAQEAAQAGDVLAIEGKKAGEGNGVEFGPAAIDVAGEEGVLTAQAVEKVVDVEWCGIGPMRKFVHVMHPCYYLIFL